VAVRGRFPVLRHARSLALAFFVGGALIAVADAPSETGKGPVPEIDGLVAWYRVDSLHRDMKGREEVSIWPDASGHGHDLVDDENGMPAIFEAVQINGLPAVRVEKSNTHAVTNPFDLDDHTIFLVYAGGRPRRGLLRNERGDLESHGIVLRQEFQRDVLQQGQASAPYGTDFDLDKAFAITALGRQAGTLRAFINGADISSGERLGGVLRVGRFFGIRHTRYVTSDGEGLRFAEMIFYDRFLDDDERNAVTSHLSEKYAIPLRYEARALLATRSPQNVNVPSEVRAIEWKDQRELRDPLGHDPEKAPARLSCSRDGTRVRLSVSLRLTSAVAGTEIRVFVLKNYEEYLPGEVGSGSMTGDGTPHAVELEVTLTLNEGEFIEIVTTAGGAEGEVTLVPGESVLSAEVLP
jgi:hypothetical protein